MKIILIAFVVSLLPLNSFTAEDSTSYTPKFSLSGFFAPETKVVRLNKQLGFLAGAHTGLLINSKYGIGLAGYGLFNKVRSDSIENTRKEFAKKNLHYNYGGLVVDYTILPFETVHGGFSLLMGMGILDLDKVSSPEKSFYILEPEWFFQGNVTRWLQIDLGFSFRFVFQLDKGEKYLREWTDYSHVSGNIAFRFGRFKTDYYQD